MCLDARTAPDMKKYWEWSFGKRPEEELYHIGNDPDCMENLAIHPEYQQVKAQLKEQMYEELKAQNDPRMFGNGHIFDEYPYAQENMKGFYERYMGGEELEAGWVNTSDFEEAPLE